jgi:hypothetical protein
MLTCHMEDEIYAFWQPQFRDVVSLFGHDRGHDHHDNVLLGQDYHASIEQCWNDN